MNNLARTLLRENLRLDTHDPQDTVIYIGKFLAGGCSPTEAEKYSAQIIEELEPLIREAIEKTIEQTSQYLHHDKICAHRKDSQAECDCGLHKLLEAYAAIRSLKQSNSGMELKTNVQL